MMDYMTSDRLKGETSVNHQLLEDKFRSSKIFDKTFTLKDYSRLIEFSYLFLLNFEEEVFAKFTPELAAELHLDERRKLHHIEKDLDALKVARSKPRNLPEIKNQHEAFGILYVMEGATLGGNVIARQLAKNPEFQGVTFNYFSCYGENTGPYWTKFKEVLNREIPEEQTNDVVFGAEKAYRFLLGFF